LTAQEAVSPWEADLVNLGWKRIDFDDEYVAPTFSGLLSTAIAEAVGPLV
jgi:hypothetical protein